MYEPTIKERLSGRPIELHDIGDLVDLRQAVTAVTDYLEQSMSSTNVRKNTDPLQERVYRYRTRKTIQDTVMWRVYQTKTRIMVRKQ